MELLYNFININVYSNRLLYILNIVSDNHKNAVSRIKNINQSQRKS